LYVDGWEVNVGWIELGVWTNEPCWVPADWRLVWSVASGAAGVVFVVSTAGGAEERVWSTGAGVGSISFIIIN